ncbi:hypothetical protein DRN74_02195 [Candidatus Micrarchaeota archaeon]|nr:MAG: hypothetical protein DRN74_02195 [Candidatus Micrarchaeota archaeon]
MKIVAVGYPLMHSRQYRILESKKHEVHIITPKKWQNVFRLPKDYDSIHFHFCDDKFHGNASLYFIPCVSKYVKELKPDLIFTMAEPWSLLVTNNEMIANKFKIPHVIAMWENLDKDLPFPFSRFEKRNIKGIEGLINGNPEGWEIYKRKGAKCLHHIDPLGAVDIKEFSKKKGDLRKELKLKGKKVILYAGRFVPQKGLLYIINSMGEVLKNVDNAHYLFVGKGELEERLKEEIRKKGVEDRVTIINWVPREKMPMLYNTADVFLYPSYRTKKWAEQFGFALIEAMACETPVITASSGSIPWVVGDAAIVVKPKNSDELGKAIVKVLTDDKLRRRLIEKGKKRAKYFSVEEVRKRYFKFFEDVAKKCRKE